MKNGLRLNFQTLTSDFLLVRGQEGTAQALLSMVWSLSTSGYWKAF